MTVFIDPYGLCNYESMEELLYFSVFFWLWRLSSKFSSKNGRVRNGVHSLYLHINLYDYLCLFPPPTANLAFLDSSSVVTGSQTCASVCCLFSCADLVCDFEIIWIKDGNWCLVAREKEKFLLCSWLPENGVGLYLCVCLPCPGLSKASPAKDFLKAQMSLMER